MIIKKSLLVIFLTIASSCYSQKSAVKPMQVGDKIPMEILKKIPTKKSTQLIILDFWATWCGNCLASFPHMEKLQQQFSDKLKVVLVNCWETEPEIKGKLDKRNRINTKDKQLILPELPRISGKSIFSKLFPTTGIPQHVWINAKGQVLAITYEYNATPKNVLTVLQRKKIHLSVKNDTLGHFLVDRGLIGTDPITTASFYSAFIEYKSDFRTGYSEKVDSATNSIRISYLGFSIIDLYKRAFSDKLRIINEVTNKELFIQPESGDSLDDWLSKYHFGFEMKTPLIDKSIRLTIFQQDLNRYFGLKFNIEARVEKRKFPSLILVKIKDASLDSLKHEIPVKENGLEYWQNVNVPFEQVVNEFTAYLEDLDHNLLFIDETGIDLNENISVEVKGGLGNIENIKTQINKYGLDIIKSEREVEVLVIRNKL